MSMPRDTKTLILLSGLVRLPAVHVSSGPETVVQPKEILKSFAGLWKHDEPKPVQQGVGTVK